jgi:hypothetical protein
MGTMDRDDLTWEQAVADFEAATPAEVVRPPRTVDVIYQYLGRRWRASSPSVRGFDVSADSLDQVREIARSSLTDYLDPAITLSERIWNPWQLSTHAAGLVAMRWPSTPIALAVATTTAITVGVTVTSTLSISGAAGTTVVTSWPQTRTDERTTLVLAEAPNALAGAA